MKALVELAMLDTPPEETFDRCLKLAANLCGVSMGAVSLIDHERQWFKAVLGRLPSETPRDVSFCGHAVAHDEVLVVNDAAADPRFADNPLVTAPGGIRFYAGVPLHGRNGQPLGTLCMIHDEPHALSRAQLVALQTIADHLEQFLTLRLTALRFRALSDQARSEKAVLERLEEERRETATMLVHDLKNPLTVISVIGRLIQSHDLPAEVADALNDLVASADVAERMVCDILDVSSAERGALRTVFERFDLPRLVTALTSRLRYVADERGQTLEVVDRLATPTVHADSTLISRALRNFLDNAFTYGPPASRIRVVLEDAGTDVEMRVEDEGPGVPEELREKIFEPYFRTSSNQGRPSHGLGLALCARVAQAHGGKTWSQPGASGLGNAFCLRIPRE